MRNTQTNTNSALPSAGPAQAVATTPAAPSHAQARLNPPASPAPRSGPAVPVARPRGGLPWTAWLLLCWSLGSLAVLCRLVLGYLSLWSLRRRCTRVTRGELFDLLGRLRKEVVELKRANAILKDASVYFATELDPTRRR